jgi:hypothetical protein
LSPPVAFCLFYPNSAPLPFFAIAQVEKKHLLDIVEHPNQEKYKGQKIFIVNIDQYAYLVPFVESEQEIFLKTIVFVKRKEQRFLIENNSTHWV